MSQSLRVVAGRGAVRGITERSHAAATAIYSSENVLLRAKEFAAPIWINRKAALFQVSPVIPNPLHPLEGPWAALHPQN
jgi:hypothetical protein